MIFRTAATAAALAILLALVGAFTGPQWDPDPVVDHVRVATSDTAIGGKSAAAEPIGTYDVRTTDVTVQLDGTSVDAVVREPVGVDHPVPGVVFVHGAGTGDAHQAFSEPGEALASAGVATLVPSKRLDTYTTSHRDYVAMAHDYLRSVDRLRSWPGVDPDRVGVYGESEGCWIVPVMADLDPAISFVALGSAPVVPPREQAAFAVDSYLRNTHVPSEIFRAIPRAVGMVLPGGGFDYVDFDVQPYQRQLTVPVFVAYGTGDSSMPIEQGAEQIVSDAASNGDDDVTVRYYAGANHGLRVGGPVSPDFMGDLSDWVASLPASAGAAPQYAGDQPEQTYLAEPVPTPRFLASGDLLLALVIVGVSMLVLALLMWAGGVLVAVLRRRPVPHPVAPRLRVPIGGLTIGTVVTFAALVVYLVEVAHLALDYEKDDWIVQGGWVVVRVLGLVTVVFGAMLLNRYLELRAVARLVDAHRVRDVAPAVSGVLGRVAVTLVLTGASIMLVMLAYWGVYQLGI
ncbi:S9 family peptidase [Cellulomonas sp. PhB143]|uniref:alpha/beta hydrolase family protein n=1 Tax=Cellulomonas sp. PhB143 TaxID=2485186 RepID=UPI000F47EE7D|nr:alpha/beta hydrolase [Cellulomonas sp. PhB143]ROS73670.1 hypothetical protein EDF32_2525 [Cellulomonas sp. PhB143]